MTPEQVTKAGVGGLDADYSREIARYFRLLD
jgi:hypothetical protein